MQYELFNPGLAVDASVHDRVKMLAGLGIYRTAVATNMHVPLQQLRSWYRGQTEPEASATQYLAACSDTVSILAGQSLPPEAINVWLRSRSHDHPFLRPLEGFNHDAQAVRASAHNADRQRTEMLDAHSPAQSLQTLTPPAERLGALCDQYVSHPVMQHLLKLGNNQLRNIRQGKNQPADDSFNAIDDVRCIIWSHIIRGYPAKDASGWLLHAPNGADGLRPISLLTYAADVCFKQLSFRLLSTPVSPMPLNQKTCRKT